MQIERTETGQSIVFDTVREVAVARAAACSYANSHPIALFRWGKYRKSPYFKLAFVMDNAVRFVAAEQRSVNLRLSINESTLCIKALRWNATRDRKIPLGAVRGYEDLITQIDK